jgi:hemerythrin
MLIEWSDKYATGIDEIDAQHQEIFNQLNRLHDAITSGLGKEVIGDILAFAYDYASRHFSYEEGCMAQLQCPVAEKNKEAHRQFIESMEQIRAAVERDDEDGESVLELYKDLREWIQSHILKIDTHLRGCAAAHRDLMGKM